MNAKLVVGALGASVRAVRVANGNVVPWRFLPTVSEDLRSLGHCEEILSYRVQPSCTTRLVSIVPD